MSLHPLERIRIDRMRPVTRIYWLWRTARQRGEILRSVRYDVTVDGLVLVRRGSPTLGARQQVMVAARGFTRPTGVGTYAQHVRDCAQCRSLEPCDAARLEWGATR